MKEIADAINDLSWSIGCFLPIGIIIAANIIAEAIKSLKGKAG